MSEKKNINDDIVFQSFSKNFIFESNKELKKTAQNEFLEFSFKKNLFVQKSDDNNTHSHNQISSFSEHNSNIYSKNDKNIQESGHFGKYESKNFKSLIEKNGLPKHPIFYIEEKYNRYNENENETNSQNGSTIHNDDGSNSSIFSKLKKIQIIRKKKNLKNNNSINYPHVKKKKADSFASIRINNNNNFNNSNSNINNQMCESYLYKKKYSNNNINLNNINHLNNDDCSETRHNTFSRINNTISINDITKYSKYEMPNIYRNNTNNFSKKMLSSKNNNFKPKIKTSLTNFSNYILNNMKENKENLPMNYNQYCHTIMNNNYYHPPNFNNISKYINNTNNMINKQPEKPYRSMCAMNKSFTKAVKFENIEKVKNDYKNKNNKKVNNINGSNTSISLIPRSKYNKTEKENKIKNYININFRNTKVVNNKSICLYKTITHKSTVDNKKGKNISCSKKTIDKAKIFKEKFTNCYGENHGIIF